METPDRKVRKLMEEYQKTGVLTKSAANADLDEKTARKYLKAGKLPSQMSKKHDWRTRPDPFEAHWPAAEQLLTDVPELEAKEVFDWFCDKYPGVYQESQLRTFQRRVRLWRALNGPDKEIYFDQEHHPGHRMSTDFTRMGKLEITIAGEPFDHMLCHCVLTYSNWEWATICHSESMLALRIGMQTALFRLGRIPVEHWTDHSTAATHRPGEETENGKRKFNKEYLDLMNHFGMKPHTIQVDEPHENGDVESLNGVLKRRIKQRLLLRGSKDFPSLDAYQAFLIEVLEKANRRRTKRLAEEMREMRILNASRLADYKPYTCPVRKSSTITVERRIYSVPSRLMDKKVNVHRYEDHLEVYFNDVLQLKAPWIGRDGTGACINYRHIIGSLVRKPGAFRNYRYRSELFPTLNFRWAYDSLCEHLCEHTADREYLQILHHAAQTMECEVDGALNAMRIQDILPRLNDVLIATRRCLPAPPEQEPLIVDLGQYDKLLSHGKEVAA